MFRGLAMILTKKQEQFTLNIFSGMSQREAYIKAGYSINTSVAIIDSHACELAKNSKVLVRLAELREKAESDKVMSVKERKERLSEIARARLTDFVECGLDGSFINIGLESANSAAIKGVKTRTEYDEHGNEKGNDKVATKTTAIITDIRLHNPINAIAELNKMEKVYDTAINVNVDNRKVEIIVASDDAQKLLTEISQGVPPHADDND